MSRLFLGIAFMTILPFVAIEPYPAISAERDTRPPPLISAVLSFEMWCREVETYSEERCNMRRIEDQRAYQQYRATMERFQQERDSRVRREGEFLGRLQSDPLEAARDTARGLR